MDKIHNNHKQNNNINFISFLSCVFSRLAYVKMPNFFQTYIRIMREIPEKIFNKIGDLNNNELSHIFDDNYLFKGLKPHEYDFLHLKLPQKINKLMKSKVTQTNNIFSNQLKEPSVKVIEIVDSNSVKVFVIADKRLNSIFVIFRGTESYKAITSWANLIRDIPNYPCKSNNPKVGFLSGILKLEVEIIHTLYYSICHLSNNFLDMDMDKRKKQKIFTTGHSLGGGLATIFSYLWLGLKYENTDNISNHICDKIVCVSLASPKVLNEYLVNNDFYHLIKEDKILYRRLVTNGDIITLQPFYMRHPINKNNSVYCSSINVPNKKQINYNKKLICNNEKDEKSFTKHSLLPHGNYMYIDFYGVLDVKKEREIFQSEYKDSIAQLFIAYTSKNNKTEENIYKLAFFYMNDVRYGLSRNDYIPHRSTYIFQIDKKEDKYMNKYLFDYMIENMISYKDYLIQRTDFLKLGIKEQYISHGRPILNIKKRLTRRMKPKSFLCATIKNIKKIVKTRKNRT